MLSKEKGPKSPLNLIGPKVIRFTNIIPQRGEVKQWKSK